ncbi:MAG: Flp family type IVb pilin [Alphaproteobacteria bacterium]|nr:Flp family type IVb pilin [Alphaproteobacteria bacterium]
MLSIFRRILKDEQGATAIEYGLIAALISVAAITAFTAVGTKLSDMMTNTANKLN